MSETSQNFGKKTKFRQVSLMKNGKKKENFAFSKQNPNEDSYELLIDAHKLLVSSILIEIQAKSESKNEISRNYSQRNSKLFAQLFGEKLREKFRNFRKKFRFIFVSFDPPPVKSSGKNFTGFLSTSGKNRTLPDSLYCSQCNKT
jgi:hypothetical protein